MARSILQIYHLVLATSGSSWEKRPRTTTILVTARFPTDGSDGGEEVGGRKVEWHRGMGHCPSQVGGRKVEWHRGMGHCPSYSSVIE
jgi:hypothetical protein